MIVAAGVHSHFLRYGGTGVICGWQRAQFAYGSIRGHVVSGRADVERKRNLAVACSERLHLVGLASLERDGGRDIPGVGVGCERTAKTHTVIIGSAVVKSVRLGLGFPCLAARGKLIDTGPAVLALTEVNGVRNRLLCLHTDGGSICRTNDSHTSKEKIFIHIIIV